MVKYLKKIKSKKIIVKCVLGIVIVSLILGTVSNYINKSPMKYIAEINGEKISFLHLKNIYHLEENNQKKILGKNFSKIKNDYKFKENMYKYALSQIINNTLLEQYTKKMQFNVEDNEIKKTILNIPIFQENNKFNQTKYLNYIASINLTNHEYIDLTKKKINTNNFINAISDTNFVLDNEKKYIIQLLSQKRIIQKAILNINPILQQQRVSALESHDYYNKHKEQFYISEKFKISYIHLKPDPTKVQCNNQEINTWYQKNINKYFHLEQRKYSIIQVKTKKEALSILLALKQGASFSDLAQKKSIDPLSAKKNGNIGWFSNESTPYEIKTAHLDKKNQISDIIKFKNTFLIIKLIKISPKKPKKISEVLSDITNDIKNTKSLEEYHSLENKIAHISKKHMNRFDLIVSESKITPSETNWFDKNSVPKLLQNSTLKKIIFEPGFLDRNNKFKSHSGVILLDNNQCFILSIKDFQEKKIKKFQNVKTSIINIIKKNKAIKKMQEKLKKIIFYLQNHNEKYLKKEKINFSKFETISRYDTNPMVLKIFSMPHPKNKKYTYAVYQDNKKNFFIIKLLKIYNQKFSLEEENVISRYLEKSNIDVVFNCILKYLYHNAIIKYF